MKYKNRIKELKEKLIIEMKNMTNEEIKDFIIKYKNKLSYAENKMTKDNYEAFMEIKDCALLVLKERKI